MQIMGLQKSKKNGTPTTFLKWKKRTKEWKFFKILSVPKTRSNIPTHIKNSSHKSHFNCFKIARTFALSLKKIVVFEMGYVSFLILTFSDLFLYRSFMKVYGVWKQKWFLIWSPLRVAPVSQSQWSQFWL